jgi:ADP-sugar diphosphatase
MAWSLTHRVPACFQMFKDWVAAIDKDPKLFVDDIHLQSVDMFGSRVGFVKFKTTARVLTAGREESVIDVPGIVFMRGGAVGILVILECEGAEYTILTRQARVPFGSHDLPEIPAGMLDGSGNFKGVAAEEMREECNLVITEDELVDLTQLAYGDRYRGIIPSAGGCDEFVRLYALRRTVDRAVLAEMQGRLTGLLAEGEHIKLQIVALVEAWTLTPDVKALSALALFNRLRDEGKLPDRALAGTRSNSLKRHTSVDQLAGVENAQAGSLIRHGRVSQFSSSSALTVDMAQEEDERMAALKSQPAGASATVQMNTISGHRAQIPITAEPGLDAGVVKKSTVFQNWVAEIDKDPVLFIEDVHIQSVDMFGPRVGFVKFQAHAKANVGGESGVIDVPGIVFMRGGAVGILVILECEGKEYTILTRQARVPVGVHDLPEIPAGMLDGSGNFKGVAAEEIHEECDISIKEEELVDLTQLAYSGKYSGLAPSAGGCDEFIKLFMLRRNVAPDVISELQGRLTGLLSEGEHIKLQIIPLSDLWKISPDAKALSAIALRDYLQMHHKLPEGRSKALSVRELSTDDSDAGFRLDGFSDSKDSKESPLRTGRMTQAWSMSSVDGEDEALEKPTSLADPKASSFAPTHVRRAGKERERRRSVSFGHAAAQVNREAMASLKAQPEEQSGQSSQSSQNGQSSHNGQGKSQPERRLSVSFGDFPSVSRESSDPSTAITKTRSSSSNGGNSPSPKSALRRGSMQGRLKRQQNPATTSDISSSTQPADLRLSLKEPEQSEQEPAARPPPVHIATTRWKPEPDSSVANSPNPLDIKRSSLDGSSSEEHSDMSADEDEVDRLMMEDLVEATWGAHPGRGSGPGGRDVVVKVKHVYEPPTYLAALYAKADANATTQLVLMLLTIVALFGDDVRLLLLPKGADSAVSAFTFIIFLLFALEWACQCLFKPDYIYSLFFWLDLLATASLITDVIFIYEAIFGDQVAIETIEIMCVPASAHYGTTADDLMTQAGAGDAGQMARTGRAARVATRTARLIRIVRVLRVLRIFKLLKFFTQDKAGEEKEPENELRDSTTMMGAKLVERISHRVIVVVLVLFVGTVLVLQGYEPLDYGPEIGLDWMQSMRTNMTVGGPPVISWLAANTYVGSVDQDLLCLKDLDEGGQLFRHLPDVIATRRDIEVQLNWAADGSAISATDNRGWVVAQAWTNLIIIMVLLVVMVGSNYVFSHDIEELVVRKISVIVDSVNKMSVTLKFLGGEKIEDDVEEEEEMETEMIETAMEKMSELLRIGFGEAGNTIISKNLKGTGELNAMLPGQHVTAVFGFCDIRKFNEITDVLRGQVMPFVNQIAKIVHEEVVLNGGAPNKNIGDAFLCSWKTEEFTETPRSQQGLDQDEQRKHKLRMRRLSLAKTPSATDMEAMQSMISGDQEIPVEYHTKADQALKSFVDVIEILRSRKTELILRKRHPRLYMHKPSFKVDMGFGLHHGWAIEGAIGSVHKVDVSYLSPHVNMSARLEAATKQFGVPLLLSGSFVKLLSEGVR